MVPPSRWLKLLPQRSPRIRTRVAIVARGAPLLGRCAGSSCGSSPALPAPTASLKGPGSGIRPEGQPASQPPLVQLGQQPGRTLLAFLPCHGGGGLLASPLADLYPAAAAAAACCSGAPLAAHPGRPLPSAPPRAGRRAAAAFPSPPSATLSLLGVAL